jgi:HSP20 family protein
MTTPTRPRDTAQRQPQRWDPLRDLADLQERLSGMIEPGGTPATWTPPVDIIEDDDSWTVEAELPGVDRKDVNIELRDNELEISGEIKERERKGILRRRTRRTGRFEYRVVLPEQPDPEGIDATLEDGVLTVRVPKPEQTRRRRVEVQAAQPS